ncbi:MAG TPA: FAD:protein FMN transferase [Pirellulales bacterium]|jgi:thiamine biosynthesis lipoprotein|nr:FAD:protein FMN transferase [Pirellulales bacterium]
MTKHSGPTRRDFLKGQAAARPDAGAGEAAHAHVAPPDSDGSVDSASPYLVQLKRRAMACDFELYLNAGQYRHATEVALEAFDLVEQLEAQLTVYRDTSEIMHLNSTAADEPQSVEARLFELLSQALKLHAETNGAFDITAGPLTKAWGFYRRAGSIPEDSALSEALERVGSRHVELDPQRQTIRFARAGVELNLGSIGKGYALDRCDELMKAAGIGDFLWHGGQSSVLARGRCATNGPGQRGWTVGLRHPMGRDRRLAEIRLEDRALATSGSSVQFFRHKGRRYGHILDPRTGWPAEGVLSATALAPTAAQADALSTAFYVMGVDASLEYCRGHEHIGAVILFPSAKGSNIEIATAGLEPQECRWLMDHSP